MKKYLLILSVLFGGICQAQKASLSGDTIFYNSKHYAVGDTVYLGYGSASDKSFVFIKTGTAMTGKTSLPIKHSKEIGVINKVYKEFGKYMVKAKFLEKASNDLGGNQIFIDVEGAVDNKELISDSQ